MQATRAPGTACRPHDSRESRLADLYHINGLDRSSNDHNSCQIGRCGCLTPHVLPAPEPLLISIYLA